MACSLYESELIGATSRMAAKMARFARCPKMPAFVIDVPRRSDRSDAASSPASNDRQLRAGFPASIRHNSPATADTVPDLQFLCCLGTGDPFASDSSRTGPQRKCYLATVRGLVLRPFTRRTPLVIATCECSDMASPPATWYTDCACTGRSSANRVDAPCRRASLALRELDQSSRGGKSCSPHSTKPIR